MAEPTFTFKDIAFAFGDVETTVGGVAESAISVLRNAGAEVEVCQHALCQDIAVEPVQRMLGNLAFRLVTAVEILEELVKAEREAEAGDRRIGRNAPHGAKNKRKGVIDGAKREASK